MPQRSDKPNGFIDNKRCLIWLIIAWQKIAVNCDNSLIAAAEFGINDIGNPQSDRC